MMKTVATALRVLAVTLLVSALSGCDDPQVYGSVGVSTGFGGYHGGCCGPRVNTSISVGGRIR